MKKTLAIFSIAAIALSLTATPAFAKSHGEKGDDNGRHLQLGLNKVFKGFNNFQQIDASKFVLMGTVVSNASNNLVVNVQASVHVPNLTNNQATVNVAAGAKINGQKKQTLTLADVKAGDQVVVTGTVAGSALTGNMIEVITPKVQGQKAFGEVTAKTATSITIKNNVTGTSQTFTTNSDTKVNIDGESKTITDVNVGDKGFVKFKNEVTGLIAKMINLFR